MTELELLQLIADKLNGVGILLLMLLITTLAIAVRGK